MLQRSWNPIPYNNAISKEVDKRISDSDILQTHAKNGLVGEALFPLKIKQHSIFKNWHFTMYKRKQKR